MYYNVYLTGTNYLVCFCLLMEKAQIYVIILHCLLTNLFKAYYAKKYCFMRNSVCFNVETSQRPMVSRSYQHSVDTALDTNFTHRRKSFTFVSFLIIIFLVHQNIYSYIFILSFLYASLFYIADCLNYLNNVMISLVIWWRDIKGRHCRKNTRVMYTYFPAMLPSYPT